MTKKTPQIYDFMIIGAGIAGLTAVYKLHQAGYNLLVLEKEANIGGRMTTITKDETTLDIRATFLSSFYS